MEKEKRYSVRLSWEELKLLDGQVNEEAQKIINQAKIEADIGFDLPIMNEILRKSLEKGTLTWTRKSIRSCSYCDKKYTYQQYTRNSRYHNKGELNYDKPLYYAGVAFNEGFVTMQGVGDMCWECCVKHQVIETLIEYILKNDLKVQIQHNSYKPGKYLKDAIVVCKDCGNEFPESTMGREPTYFSGTYPSRCPHCQSKNTSKKRNEFTFILNPRGLPEVLLIESSVKEYNQRLGETANQDGFEFYQSQRNPDEFIVEKRYSNRFQLLRFNTHKKTFRIQGGNPTLDAEWENTLTREGYSREEDKHYPIIKKGAKRC